MWNLPTQKKDDYLIHYASKYYDPEYMKEYNKRYYEEHKVLKGYNRGTGSLSDEGKQFKATEKENITNEKKQKLEELQNEKTTNIEALRENASITKEHLTEQLKRFKERLKEKIVEMNERDRENASEEIARIKDTDSLSDKDKQRNALRVRKELGNTIDSRREESNEVYDVESERVRGLKTQVANELSAAVLAARDAYTKSKTELNKKYEDIYQSEYDKILAQFPKPKTSKGGKSSKSSNSSSGGASGKKGMNYSEWYSNWTSKINKR